MNKIMREILRSWNTYGETTLIRPTPYKISKFLNVTSSMVYKEWKTLFSTGFIKKVILRPSDRFAGRAYVFFSHEVNNTPKEIINVLKKPYFVENINICHIYSTAGIPEQINKNRWMSHIEIINSSSKTLNKQIELVFNGIIKNDDVIMLGNTERDSTCNEDNITKQLISSLAYKDIYAFTLNDIADSLKISTRTVSRKLEKIIFNGDLTYFPVLNQSVPTNNNIFTCYLFNSKISSGNELLKKFSNMPLVYERYLLFYFTNNYINIILYYNTTEELETCINELMTISASIITASNFKRYFNDDVIFERIF